MTPNRDIRWLRNIAIFSFVACMALVLVGGYYAKDMVAPIAGKVTCGQQVCFDHDSILRGQDVFHRYGLMDHGSIWGNGTYRAMDFSADTLHRIGIHIRDFHASPSGQPQAGAYDKLDADRRNALDSQTINEIKANRYDKPTDTLTLTPAQGYALEQTRAYWNDEFEKGDTRVGFKPQTVPTAQERLDLGNFFFWTAWAAGANRPGESFSYTSNWPSDPTTGNYPMPQAIIWSILSIMALLVVLGIIVYIVHRWRFFFGEARGVEAAHRIMETPLMPSQRASAKFFLVAGLLFLVQILNGGLLANYTVRPGKFYIQTIGDMYSYSWAKTWHLQLGILWIATSWIATAIYVVPLISRREPRGQSTLVNILFWALVAVVAGSLLGEVLSIKGYLAGMWYWFGHQGWEYLELGRIWQILLFGGLIFWLVIVYRSLTNVLSRRKAGTVAGEAVLTAEQQQDHDMRRSLTIFYVLSAILVVAFFGFGLFYRQQTHPTIADYWRWFVVHIWVESIFEFFGVAIIALFLVTLGLVTVKSALRVAYLTAILVFVSGIPGVAHHYYWFGGPSFWLGVGGVFSSLEPVPLILLVVRAWMEYRSIHAQGREFPYRWPLYFLVASSVWNFIGAAIFGFIINLPIVNYYVHGSYMTINHAHTALFGVYGMLAIALILFSWRGLVEKRYWSDRLLKFSFWSLNIGLAMMFITSLLPMGLMQAWYTADKGYWFARRAEFYELPWVSGLAEWRIVPDMILIVFGALPLLWFLATTFFRLRTVGPQPTQKEIEED